MYSCRRWRTCRRTSVRHCSGWRRRTSTTRRSCARSRAPLRRLKATPQDSATNSRPPPKMYAVRTHTSDALCVLNDSLFLSYVSFMCVILICSLTTISGCGITFWIYSTASKKRSVAFLPSFLLFLPLPRCRQQPVGAAVGGDRSVQRRVRGTGGGAVREAARGTRPRRPGPHRRDRTEPRGPQGRPRAPRSCRAQGPAQAAPTRVRMMHSLFFLKKFIYIYFYILIVKINQYG